jgi:hypothetical protein
MDRTADTALMQILGTEVVVVVPIMGVATHMRHRPMDKVMVALLLRVEHRLLPHMVEVERPMATMVVTVLPQIHRTVYVFFVVLFVDGLFCCGPLAFCFRARDSVFVVVVR